MISRTGWIFLTKATLWPAIRDPCSTSPSTTARRRAPTQNSSSLTWASSRESSPDLTLFRSSSWRRLKSRDPSFRMARTGIVGSDASNCAVGMASRACARMNASLNRGCATHSSATTNRVPSWAPAAPSVRYWAIISPVPIPPATKMGTSVTLRRNSCARTDVATGPICPPASFPSMTKASTPCLMRRFARDNTGAKQRSLAPEAFTCSMSLPEGMLPAKMTNGAFSRITTSMCSRKFGATVIRLTPKGNFVFRRVASISSARRSGGMFPPARTPNPPAFEMAATRLDSETHVMAPQRIAYRVPRKSVPRFHAAGRYLNSIVVAPMTNSSNYTTHDRQGPRETGTGNPHPSAILSDMVLQSEFYDVTVVGAGPVGLYAAYYAGLRDCRTKLIEMYPQVGGRLISMYPEKEIFDVAGHPKIVAADLVRLLTEQAMQYPSTIVLSERVTGLRVLGERIVELATENGTHYSQTVIIAAGCGAFVPRKL